MFGWPAVDVVQMIQTIVSLTHSATQVMYKSGNEILTVNGNFPSFDANGDPTSGTITSIVHTTQNHSAGIMEATITGLNLQVAIVYPIIFSGNSNGLQSLILGDADTFQGSVGGDVLFGYGGGDTLNGGDGNDQLDYLTNTGAGFDLLNGGAGDDRIGSTTPDNVDGGDGLTFWLWIDPVQQRVSMCRSPTCRRRSALRWQTAPSFATSKRWNLVVAPAMTRSRSLFLRKPLAARSGAASAMTP